MSEKLIVINIGGMEYIGEEPKKWPPEKGLEWILENSMQVERRVMGTDQGPARTIFMHPLGDYHVKSYNGYRKAMPKEVSGYEAELETTRIVKTVRKMPPELAGEGRAGPKPPGSGILAAR